jgi:hypothetical protein
MTEKPVQAKPSEFKVHIKAASKSVAKQWGSLIPKEFWQYGREARREFLLAFRAVVDSAIARLEGDAEKPAASAPNPRTRRKTKVEVEGEA